MPPTSIHQDCVMFVCAEREGERVPVGTAFLIATSPDQPGRALFLYFVTARHVVANGQPTWIRLRRRDGSPPEDKPVHGWVSHPTSDIAVAPCDLQLDGFVAMPQVDDWWSDKNPPGVPPQVGDRAFFIGLLGDVPSMAVRAIPMTRAASVGAMYVEDVPVKDRRPGFPDYTYFEPQAHLIDCFARSGFSGAPVFIDHVAPSVYNFEDPLRGQRQIGQLFSELALLGVLVGHFGRGDQNTGVAIVVPIEALRETLEDDRLAKWREGKAAAVAQKRQRDELENAAVLDYV